MAGKPPVLSAAISLSVPVGFFVPPSFFLPPVVALKFSSYAAFQIFERESAREKTILSRMRELTLKERAKSAKAPAAAAAAPAEAEKPADEEVGLTSYELFAIKLP